MKRSGILIAALLVCFAFHGAAALAQESSLPATDTDVPATAPLILPSATQPFVPTAQPSTTLSADTATQTILTGSQPVPGEFYISHIIPDPEANLIRFAEDGSAILGASYTEQFKATLETRKQECISNHEQMSAGELVNILATHDQFNYVFTAYAICQYSIQPQNDFCNPAIFHNVLPAQPYSSGLKPVPLTAEQTQAGRQRIDDIQKFCEQNYLLYGMMKGIKEYRGKNYAEANCDINAGVFRDRNGCLESLNAFAGALEKNDPALCDGISEQTETGRYSKIMCRVWTKGDPALCAEMNQGADTCKSLFLAFKALHNNDPSIIDYLLTKQSLILYPAVKATFDNGYCSRFYESDVQPVFCTWKYDAARNDVMDFFKAEIEAARKEQTESTGGSSSPEPPKGKPASGNKSGNH